MSCDFDALEQLVMGELDGARAREVEAHAARCKECTQELAWLRTERELFARRARENGAPTGLLYPGVQARLAHEQLTQPGRTRGWRRGAWVGLTVAAVAAAAMLVIRLQPQPRVAVAPIDAGAVAKAKLDPNVALDRAQKEYEAAIAVLENELTRSGRGDLVQKIEGQLGKIRAEVAAAKNDPDARLAVLDSYAEYMRSLQEEVRR